MSRVAVNANVLRWAIERSGRTVPELEGRFPKIREWLSGQTNPTLRQLESLAKSTLTPLGYLFLPEPPEERLPIPYCRTVDDEPPSRFSAEFLETVQLMQRRQAWMREYLLNEDHDPLPFVQSAEVGELSRDVAQRIRQTLGFDERWASEQPTWEDALRTLRRAMEDIGILVVVNGVVGNNNHRQLDTREFRGFVLVDDHAPLVFVNNSDGKAAQMFTLAHELAHVFFGSSAAFDLRNMQPADDPMEEACNEVAAEFLVPAQELHTLWISARNDPEPFQTIARTFKVSAIVAARRALDLDLITKEHFFDFYDQYLNDARRSTDDRSGHPDFYVNQKLRVSRRFASAVAHAIREGTLLYSEAYRLTGLYGQTFDRFLASIESGEAS